MRRALLVLVLCAACATVRPERGLDRVDAVVQERAGIPTGWGEGEPGGEAIQARIAELLQGGLTKEGAIEIALLANPSIQATYAGLGVSQAEMVQAGLLPNPTLGGSVGFPVDGSGGRLEYETSIAQSFLDVFVLPLRKRVASEQFMADTLLVAHEVLRLAAQASSAFVRYQAAENTWELQRVLVQAALAAAAEMEARYRAGNVPLLDHDRARVAYEEARQELSMVELERIAAREELNRTLGLWGPNADWELAEPLAEALPDEVEVDALEALAIRQRLDIDAARKQALLLWNALGIARSTRYLGVVEVGVHLHQDPDGPRLFGPTLSLELPIFDRRQALIARLEGQRAQAERRLEALSVAARAEVRAAGARLQGIRQQLDHQRTVILPLRERIVDGAQRQYNAMLIGLSEVLDAKRAQVVAYRTYLDTLRDYWITRAELERLVGGHLPPAVPREAEP